MGRGPMIAPSLCSLFFFCDCYGSIHERERERENRIKKKRELLKVLSVQRVSLSWKTGGGGMDEAGCILDGQAAMTLMHTRPDTPVSHLYCPL